AGLPAAPLIALTRNIPTIGVGAANLRERHAILHSKSCRLNPEYRIDLLIDCGSSYFSQLLFLGKSLAHPRVTC
uniref:hypothetical protein n=2 Tax=Turicimonas muris TaxID=1796652 RepID=UPI0025740767